MIRASAFSVVGGLAIGVATNLLQGVLPGHFNSIANSGSVWVVGAFVAGALATRRAPLLGLLTQVFAVVGYYGYAELFRDGMGSAYAPAVWLGFALVGGPIFGLAGTWWRRGAGRRPIMGAGLLGGVFGMDGLWHLMVLHYLPTGMAFCVVAVLVPLALGRTWRERLLGVLCAALVAPLAVSVLSIAAAVTGL
ncbi:DUF6518 family protein [Lentzea sp. NBRC 105346]|uniref:DUF6518 family protein n=1 Tax=Lentzea sp. NBRC 105346 TaxID=3032205 RepID=UPI002555AD2C|nr:DUF6518 family protein [Lentzea sp. NBRC 105346]